MFIALPKTLSDPALLSRFNYRLSWLLFITLSILVCVLSFKRGFDHDEFEAIKTAWYIYSGEQIYIDFFQHHHPPLYYILSWLFPIFGESKTTILASRAVSLGFFFGIIFVIYKLSHKVFDKNIAVVSIIFLLCITLYVLNAIEVRPDVPQAFFGLFSVYLLFCYFRSDKLIHLILSSLLLGVSFIFLQKSVFLIFLIHGVLIWRVFNRQLPFRNLMIFSTILFSTWVGLCGYYYLTGQFFEYFFFNFEYNFAKLEQSGYQKRILLEHVQSFNAIIIACFMLSLLLGKTQKQWELTFLSIGLLIATVAYRTQYAQYYILVLPLLAVISAHGWNHIRKLQPLIATIVLVAVTVGPIATYLYYIGYRKNDQKLNEIMYVVDITNKSDYVYDGDIWFNIFRKDLDFIWYGVRNNYHLDKYQMLTGHEYDIYKLIDKYKPKVISSYAISNMNHPVIRDYYKQSEHYKDLYIRQTLPNKNKTSGMPLNMDK